ncbi:hypothetical protein [Teredinibacter turnerae]|uniref:hypothetical protein n=1 Tax=Teredinibacter turnerae TaxID=2426 RepID=UPI0030CFBDE1
MMWIIKLFGYISPWLIVALVGNFIYAVVRLIRLIYSKLKSEERVYSNDISRFFPIIGAFFIILICLKCMSVAVIFESKKMLNEVSVVVFVDNKPIDKIQVDEFKTTMENFSSSKRMAGSRPGEKKNIVIKTSEKELNFLFKQDSRNGRLFWVFFPDYLLRAQLGFVESKLIEDMMK